MEDRADRPFVLVGKRASEAGHPDVGELVQLLFHVTGKRIVGSQSSDLGIVGHDDFRIASVQQRWSELRLEARPVSVTFGEAEPLDLLPRHLELQDVGGRTSAVAPATPRHRQRSLRRVGLHVVAQEPSTIGRLYDPALFRRHFEFQARGEERPHRGHRLARFRFRADDSDQEVIGVSAVAQSSVVGIERVSGGQQVTFSSKLRDLVERDAAAKSLGLTGRQLQTELQRRETSFEEQVALVRQRLATRYLRDTDLPMTEIALMLGYSELSAFTRAAKSWFSVPPSEKRTQLRAEKDII